MPHNLFYIYNEINFIGAVKTASDYIWRGYIVAVKKGGGYIVVQFNKSLLNANLLQQLT